MKMIVEKQEDGVMERKKSAKDLAFEKERAKYRHIINDLSSEKQKICQHCSRTKRKDGESGNHSSGAGRLDQPAA